MSQLTVEEAQKELARGIEFYTQLDAQITALIQQVSDGLEPYGIHRLRRPYRIRSKKSGPIQTHVLLLSLESADEEVVDEESETEDENEPTSSAQAPVTFTADTRFPYLIVQMEGKPPKGFASDTAPFLQYGTITPHWAKDDAPIDGDINMSRKTYAKLFKLVCSPRRQPPYRIRLDKKGPTIFFKEDKTVVKPLAWATSPSQLDELAKDLAELVVSEPVPG